MTLATGRTLLPDSNLREKTLEILRQEVATGQLKPGVLYSATSLAKQLNISTGPAREAMLALVNEGTLEVIRNRGFRLVELSEKDLQEIVELRLVVEVYAVRQAAVSDVSGARAELEGLVKATEQSTTDAPGFLIADRAFHLFIVSLQSNERLLEFVRKLRDQTRLYGLGSDAEEGLRVKAAREHRQLTEALLARDAQAASEIMTAHLGHITTDWR